MPRLLCQLSGCLVAATLLVGCSSSDNQPRGFAEVVVSNAAESLLPGKFRVQNLPGSFSVTAAGSPGGKYWDQHGRVYGMDLSLWCSGRDSSARLRFPAGLAGANPLPLRGNLQAGLSIDGGPVRWVPMKRSPSMPVLTGGLPLVRSLLGSSRVVLYTASFEGQTLTAEFDTRGLRDAVKGHDFFCKSQWLAGSANAQPPEPETSDRPDAGTLAMRRESVRSAVAELDGVTSVIWLGDGTLMLGMGGASNHQMTNAALDACDILYTHPDLPRQIEVQDTRATRDRTMRITCPR